MLSIMEEKSIQRLIAKMYQSEEILEDDEDAEEFDLSVEDDDWGNDF